MANSNFLIPSVIQAATWAHGSQASQLNNQIKSLVFIEAFYCHDNNNVAYHFNLRKSLLKLIKLHNSENFLLVFFLIHHRRDNIVTYHSTEFFEHFCNKW